MTYSPISGMNTRMLPVIRPGRGDRQRDLAERRQAAGTEVLGCLDQRAIHPFQRHVDREHHQRQVAVDDAEEDRAWRAEDPEAVGRRSTSPMNPAMPSGPRIVSQAYVRIRKLVQNGTIEQDDEQRLAAPAACRDEVGDRQGRPAGKGPCPDSASTRLVTNGEMRLRIERVAVVREREAGLVPTELGLVRRSS